MNNINQLTHVNDVNLMDLTSNKSTRVEIIDQNIEAESVEGNAQESKGFNEVESLEAEIPVNFKRERRVSDVIDSIGFESVNKPTSQDVLKKCIELSDPESPCTPSNVGYSTPPSDMGYSTHPSDMGYSTPPSDVGYSSSLGTSTPQSPSWPSKSGRNLDTVDAQPSTRVSEDPNPASYDIIEADMPVYKDSLEYNMNHNKRGHAIIFNNDTFEMESMAARDGSKIDVKNMEMVFEKLGFEVVLHENLKFNTIMNVIKKLSEANHSDADCLVVAVLTHGMDNGYLYAKDVPYKVDMLWAPFTADKCRTLAGKPKIFFIQACRGEKLDQGVHLASRRMSRTETDSSPNSYKIPTHSDFLIAYSSVEGYYSWRNTENGTWFIQCLCQELSENAHCIDLLKLLTRTSRRVALDHESYHDVKPWLNQQKQVPSITSMLIRDIYFRPKN